MHIDEPLGVNGAITVGTPKDEAQIGLEVKGVAGFESIPQLSLENSKISIQVSIVDNVPNFSIYDKTTNTIIASFSLSKDGLQKILL